ncbi:uncharacterized protein LOC142230508 [Haematobia irritans]|uniref:uncharacterized protein LOC142230508 n=1 Tax=Haematobia irritans TaxID=7368 RepID=UPI003F4F62B6
MFNNVMLPMTHRLRRSSLIDHQQVPSEEHAAKARRGGGRGKFLMKPLRMLLLMSMVLSAGVYIRPSMAESETNDLNSLVAKKPMIMSLKPMPVKLERRQQQQLQRPNAAQYMPETNQLPTTFAGCPLCDSSVYSYCSHKLLHDTCCCDYPGSIYQKPPQCIYYECSLLYAKSCYEHSLIKNCCCNNPY